MDVVGGTHEFCGVRLLNGSGGCNSIAECPPLLHVPANRVSGFLQNTRCERRECVNLAQPHKAPDLSAVDTGHPLQVRSSRPDSSTPLASVTRVRSKLVP